MSDRDISVAADIKIIVVQFRVMEICLPIKPFKDCPTASPTSDIRLT